MEYQPLADRIRPRARHLVGAGGGHRRAKHGVQGAIRAQRRTADQDQILGARDLQCVILHAGGKVTRKAHIDLGIVVF